MIRFSSRSSVPRVLVIASVVTLTVWGCARGTRGVISGLGDDDKEKSIVIDTGDIDAELEEDAKPSIVSSLAKVFRRDTKEELTEDPFIVDTKPAPAPANGGRKAQGHDEDPFAAFLAASKAQTEQAGDLPPFGTQQVVHERYDDLFELAGSSPRQTARKSQLACDAVGDTSRGADDLRFSEDFDRRLHDLHKEIYGSDHSEAVATVQGSPRRDAGASNAVPEGDRWWESLPEGPDSRQAVAPNEAAEIPQRPSSHIAATTTDDGWRPYNVDLGREWTGAGAPQWNVQRPVAEHQPLEPTRTAQAPIAEASNAEARNATRSRTLPVRTTPEAFTPIHRISQSRQVEHDLWAEESAWPGEDFDYAAQAPVVSEPKFPEFPTLEAGWKALPSNQAASLPRVRPIGPEQTTTAPAEPQEEQPLRHQRSTVAAPAEHLPALPTVDANTLPASFQDAEAGEKTMRLASLSRSSAPEPLPELPPLPPLEREQQETAEAGSRFNRRFGESSFPRLPELPASRAARFGEEGGPQLAMAARSSVAPPPPLSLGSESAELLAEAPVAASSLPIPWSLLILGGLVIGAGIWLYRTQVSEAVALAARLKEAQSQQ